MPNSAFSLTVDSDDELIGFHLNDAQYFYIKNLNGDIVGIMDYDGDLIA